MADCSSKSTAQSLSRCSLGVAGKEDDIIEIYDSLLELHVAQTNLHKVLKCCWSINQPKWHLPTLVEPQGGPP